MWEVVYVFRGNLHRWYSSDHHETRKEAQIHARMNHKRFYCVQGYTIRKL